MHPESDPLLDDLLLESRTGKVSKEPPVLALERELNAEDIARLNSGETLPAVPEGIGKIRYRHQMAARLVAEGFSNTRVALATGYSETYISGVLLHDPAFKDLIAYFKEQKDAIYNDVHEKLAQVGMSALERIADRLDDDERAEGLSIGVLKEVAEFGLGNSIAPKKSSPSNDSAAPAGLVLNLNFSSPKKAEEAKPERNAVVIDVEAEDAG